MWGTARRSDGGKGALILQGQRIDFLIKRGNHVEYSMEMELSRVSLLICC